jgi:hypothetical protein
LWVVFFFFCLSLAAVLSSPPSVRCGSLSLHAVLRFRRPALWSTSFPALELAFCCVCLLGACFFASPPFSGSRSVICQLAPCCQLVVMICCLFFNFAVLFDFGCCLLAQEMSFVVCYLPYFKQGLITCPVSFPAFLVVCLLIVGSLASYHSLPSLGHFQHFCPSAVC